MKALVVRFSSIGDIVLTSPVVRCLKEQTNCTIHYLTKEPFAGLLEANPHIDRVFTIRNRINEVVKDLQSESYDLLVDLHHNIRTLDLKRKLKIETHSFSKINIQKWLKVNLKIDRLPSTHIIERYLETVAHLGVVNDGEGLEYYIPPDQDQEFLELAAKILPPNFIAISVGAAHQTKCLTAEQIAELCDSIELPVVLLGGPGEVGKATRIQNNCKQPVHNLVGKLSIGGTASCVSKAQAVVSHDTGVMHIAAAFKKRIASIWGNTIPEFGMYPYYGKYQIENKIFQIDNLSCRPCSKIGFEKCPKGHFRCILDHDLEKISKTVNSWIK